MKNAILLLCFVLPVLSISISSCTKKHKDVVASSNDQVRKSLVGKWYLKNYYQVSYDTSGNLEKGSETNADFIFNNEYVIFNDDDTWKENSTDPVNALSGTYSIGDKVSEYNFSGHRLIKTSVYTDSSIILELSDKILKLGTNEMRTSFWGDKKERDEYIVTYERLP